MLLKDIVIPLRKWVFPLRKLVFPLRKLVFSLGTFVISSLRLFLPYFHFVLVGTLFSVSIFRIGGEAKQVIFSGTEICPDVCP